MSKRDIEKPMENLDPSKQDKVWDDAGRVDPKAHRQVHSRAGDHQASTELVHHHKLPALEIKAEQAVVAVPEPQLHHNKVLEAYCNPIQSRRELKAWRQEEVSNLEALHKSFSPGLQDLLHKHPQLDVTSDGAKVVKQYFSDSDKISNERLAYAIESDRHDMASKQLLEDMAKVGVHGTKAAEALKRLPPQEAAEFKHRGDELLKEKDRLMATDVALRKEELAQQQIYERIGLAKDLQSLDKLPPEKRQEIYKNIDSILDAHQPSILKPADRQQVAQDLIHQIAHPEDIKQGHKPTCALASTEFYLAKNHPEIYARSMACIARSGELDGVKMPIQDYQNNDIAMHRSLASALFQNAAADIVTSMQGATYLNFKPGEAPKLSQGNFITPSDDTGDRILTKDGKIIAWHGVTDHEQAALLQRLTGHKYTVDTAAAANPAQMQQQIEYQGKRYGYPVHFSINGHAININGIDAHSQPPRVLYDDTNMPRGMKQESVPIGQFYELLTAGPKLDEGFQLGPLHINGDIMVPLPVAGAPQLVIHGKVDQTRLTRFIRPDDGRVA